MQDLMPNILTQLGPNAIKAMLESMSKGKGGMGGLEQMLGGMNLGAGGEEGMPDLEEGADFEAVSNE